jgi:hypothetical protein
LVKLALVEAEVFVGVVGQPAHINEGLVAQVGPGLSGQGGSLRCARLLDETKPERKRTGSVLFKPGQEFISEVAVADGAVVADPHGTARPKVTPGVKAIPFPAEQFPGAGAWPAVAEVKVTFDQLCEGQGILQDEPGELKAAFVSAAGEPVALRPGFVLHT